MSKGAASSKTLQDADSDEDAMGIFGSSQEQFLVTVHL